MVVKMLTAIIAHHRKIPIKISQINRATRNFIDTFLLIGIIMEIKC